MDRSEKQKLSESDICDLFITPVIREAGGAEIALSRIAVSCVIMFSP